MYVNVYVYIYIYIYVYDDICETDHKIYSKREWYSRQLAADCQMQDVTSTTRWGQILLKEKPPT